MVVSVCVSFFTFVRVIIVENIVNEVGVKFPREVTVESKNLFGWRKHDLAHGTERVLQEYGNENGHYVSEKHERKVHKDHVLVVVEDWLLVREEDPEEHYTLEEEGWVGESGKGSEELGCENISEDWQFANEYRNEN